MPRLSLVLLAVLTVSSHVVADDYRAEARASYGVAENEGPDGEAFGLQGTYYFGEVGTDDVPLGEAAFLGRESMMALEVTRAGAGGGNQTLWRLDSDIYTPTAIPLFLSAGLTRYETLRYDPDTFDPSEGHDTAWDAAIGVTPIDGLRIATRFYQGAGYDPNVDVKYVGELGDGRWFGVGAHLQESDDGHFYWGASADFFPSRTLKLGATYDYGYRTLWLVAEKFLTPRASVMAAYVATSDLADGFRIEAAWSF